VTFFAILTISGAVLATTACITLLGWRLGILESITISLSVGKTQSKSVTKNFPTDERFTSDARFKRPKTDIFAILGLKNNQKRKIEKTSPK
jgi:hypothetical protein